LVDSQHIMSFQPGSRGNTSSPEGRGQLTIALEGHDVWQ